MGVVCACFTSAQDSVHRPSTPTELELIAIGNGPIKKGETTGSRVYQAPDGTKGTMFYSKFDSLEAAQKHIEKAIKVTSRVISREQNQNNNNEKGQLISDRILAVGNLPESHKEEFVLIRRDGLKCYFIESVSLQVAMQIEDLIVR
jgi:hypothetical protein